MYRGRGRERDRESQKKKIEGVENVEGKSLKKSTKEG
jgi:hypothetical protein